MSVRNHFDHSSTLFTETGSLNQTQGSPIWLVLLASFFQQSCLCLPELPELVSRHARPPTWHFCKFYGSKLQASGLQSQHVNSGRPPHSKVFLLRAEKVHFQSAAFLLFPSEVCTAVVPRCQAWMHPLMIRA